MTDSTLDSGFDDMGYGFSFSLAKSIGPAIGERKLWCEILERALIDAKIINNNTANKKKKRISKPPVKAVQYLRSRDFEFVCNMVNINPEVIRAEAQRRMR